MTEGDERYKLGELTADMAAVKHDVEEIKADQKEIIAKIDNLKAVTVERWEKRNKYVDDMFAAHDLRLKSLEDTQRIDEASIWFKVRKFLDKEMVRVFGLAIMGVLVASLFYYVQKSSDYADTLKEVQKAINQE